MISVSHSRCFGLLVAVLVTVLGGCTTTNPYEPELPTIATPDGDDGPQFCNPQGKSGADLSACLAKNEELSKEFDEEAKRREPWFNFTPDNWTDSEQLGGDKVLPVVKESDAVTKLAAAPAVELSPSDVKNLTGKDANVSGLKPFLVRALFYHKDNGEFSVFKKGSALLVQHDSIGTADSVKEQRTGLVVFLDAAPNPVYVDCSLAD